jgi:hypothetical protein
MDIPSPHLPISMSSTSPLIDSSLRFSSSPVILPTTTGGEATISPKTANLSFKIVRRVELPPRKVFRSVVRPKKTSLRPKPPWLSVARDGTQIMISAREFAISNNLFSYRKVVKSVEFKDDDGTHTIDATDILVAAGPWTPNLLPSVSLLTPRGHSVIVKPTRPLSPSILFPNIQPAPASPFDELLSPDIYPRPADQLYEFDTVYASGPDDYETSLPSGTGDVELVDQKCANVLKAIGSVSQEIHDGALVKKQAYYKPQIRKHEEDEEVGPMVGPVGTHGLWVATGHDEWGIQNGPGTGLVMSEMILEGKAHSADCSSLDPKHFFNTSTKL